MLFLCRIVTNCEVSKSTENAEKFSVEKTLRMTQEDCNWGGIKPGSSIILRLQSAWEREWKRKGMEI